MSAEAEGGADTPSPGERFNFAPDPEAPGWYVAPPANSGRFIDIFGAVRMRREGDRIARIRVTPEARHTNVFGTVHGGFIMALVDQALFFGPSALGIERVRGAVTIESATQFYGYLHADRPIDVVVELLRETGRFLFLRGVIEQDGETGVSFQGAIRKAAA